MAPPLGGKVPKTLGGKVPKTLLGDAQAAFVPFGSGAVGRC